MGRKSLLILGIAALALLAWFIAAKGRLPSPVPPSERTPGLEDLAFELEGRRIVLKDGRFEEPLPGSATTMVTALTQWRAEGDLDGDGTPDAAAVVVDDPGGSGTFQYVVAVLNSTKGPVPTNAVFLGDRVRVTGLSIGKGTLIVKQKVRKSGAPRSAEPTASRDLRLVLRKGVLAPPSALP